jgi:hypothetical protein
MMVTAINTAAITEAKMCAGVQDSRISFKDREHHGLFRLKAIHNSHLEIFSKTLKYLLFQSKIARS